VAVFEPVFEIFSLAFSAPAIDTAITSNSSVNFKKLFNFISIPLNVLILLKHHIYPKHCSSFYAGAENVGGGEDVCPLTKKLVRAVIVSLGLDVAVALIVTERQPPGLPALPLKVSTVLPRTDQKLKF
jgi:hypothetical protein